MPAQRKFPHPLHEPLQAQYSNFDLRFYFVRPSPTCHLHIFRLLMNPSPPPLLAPIFLPGRVVCGSFE